MKIRIIDGTCVRREPVLPGEVVDVSDADALDLVASGRVVPIKLAEVREAAEHETHRALRTMATADARLKRQRSALFRVA